MKTETENQTHAALPWRISPACETSVVQDETGKGISHTPVCSKQPYFDYETQKANARLIVRAVNSHADLIAAAGAMLELLNNSDVRFKICDGGRGNLGEQSLYHRTINQARAALAKAKE